MEAKTPVSHQPSVDNTYQWTTTDTQWSLSIFGAAVGAGILFLPINAGIGGIWPLIVLSILLIPLTFITHRSVLRFCLAAKNPTSDFNEAATEHLGKTKGFLTVVAYFAFIFPIVMAYSIGVTNTVESLLSEQLGWPTPDRWLLSLILVGSLVAIVNSGEKIILKVTAAMVYPLAAILVAISIYLIPMWNLEQFSQPLTVEGFASGFLSTLPILIFALAYIPVCSTMAQSYRSKIKDVEVVRKKTESITFRGTALLMTMTLLFTFSCVLTLSPDALLQAKQNNISVMTLFALEFSNPWFVAVTSIVGITAICSSFLSYYMGAREGLSGLVQQYYSHSGRKVPQKHHLNRIINTFYILTLWLVGYLNLGVIDIMGAVAAPLMAVILYIVPVYATRKCARLQAYRSKVDALTVAVGFVSIGAYIAASAI